MLRICMECTISSVLSKKGSLWETLTWIRINPREAMKLLNGPSKFNVLVMIVTFHSLILVANVAAPPPISSPFRLPYEVLC